MKKLVVMAISAGMMVMAVGCSGKTVGSDSTPTTTPQVTVAPQEGNQATNQEGQSSQIGGQAIQAEVLFGKVKSLVGNELEFDLATPQMFAIEEGELGGTGEKLEMSENQINIGGTAMIGPDGTVTTDGDVSISDQPLGELQGAGSATVGEGNQGGMELDYTGETKTLTIPAGAIIFDMTKGKEVKLSELKEGNILNIMYTKNGDSIVVERIDIME